MKRKIGSIVVFLFFTIPAFSVVLETIDAVVNGDLILTSEVEEQLRIMPDINFDSLSPEQMAKLRRQMLMAMINENLLMQEAKKTLSPQQKEFIAQRVEQFTDQAMEQYRIQHNLTTPEALAQEEKRLRISWGELRRLQYLNNEKKYLKSTVIPQLTPEKPTPPTPEEIQKFQEEHPDVKPGDRIMIAHILLRIPSGATAAQEQEVLQRAKEIAARARAGEAFEALAQKYSEHEPTRSNRGLLPPFSKGQYLKEFDPLFDLKVDAITDPIRTQLGYHVIKIVQKDTLEDLVMENKLNQIVQHWLNDLRKKANIQIREGSTLKPLAP